MAGKEPVKMPDLPDEVEMQIVASFDLLIDCIAKRRTQVLSQYRDRRDERRAADTSRKETLQQLSETKLELQGKMKSNELHSMLDKMLNEVEEKITELEKEKCDMKEEMIFEYDVKYLEDRISQFGKLTSLNTESESSSNESQDISQTIQPIEVLEAEKSSLKFDKKLSSDAISEIWEGYLNEKKVLIKKNSQDGVLTKDNFLREIEILNKLSHENIAQLCAVYRGDDPVSLVYEFMPGGPLTEFLRTGDGALFMEPKLVDVCIQVAGAMTYLKSKNCIHRDLAARNVLVGGDGLVKLCGFALAVFLDGKFYQGDDSEIFPIRWAACETILYSRCSVKSDAWSFGVFLWEVFTFGCHPYPELDNEQVKERVIPPLNHRLDRPTGCSESLYQMMLKCWSVDPEDRPSFESIKIQLESLNANPQT